ncbi:fibronectin type III domain-containing protein, partial [Salmonella sp. s51228]|uniref:fibronectin type III domain-containing protein n=1 Tax=Salmonella sp. s51228 TaxID=3159652 RepID=UPI0039809D67
MNTQISLTTLKTGLLPVLSVEPQNLTAAATESDSILVTWSSPCNSRKIDITHYLLSYSDVNSGTSVITINNTDVSLSNYTHMITGLVEYITYSIK